MDDEKKVQQARKVYETCLKMFDNRNWHYKKNDEKLMIECKVSGDDLPMDIDFRIVPGLMVIQVLSQLPCKFKEDMRVEGAVATQIINYKLVDGSFDYNLETGSIIFRLTSSFRDSLISEELIAYMLDITAITVDDYNDKLFAYSSGMMDFEGFVNAINK